MIRFWLLFLGAIVLLSSCVSNRKYLYLQKDDVNRQNVPKDSVVRTYAVDSFKYKIQSNDIISVRIKSLTEKEFDFFSEYAGNNQMNNLGVGSGVNALLIGELVDEQGCIPFPVIGKVKVAQLTVFQVQDTLQKLANKYFESPIVKVRLLNYRITILGEVAKEGSIILGNNRVSMLEAIGLAGGLGELADRTHIKLVRQHDNTAEIVYLNILDEKFVQSPYYYVNQNDVLIIPPLKQRPFRKYFAPNIGLAVSTISIILLALNLLK
jgi:polysaccharide export outer membrane protein